MLTKELDKKSIINIKQEIRFLDRWLIKWLRTNLICFWAEEEKVERNSCDHVDEEPTFKVVYGNVCRIAHDLVVLVDVRSTEVYEDIDDEHDVNNQVNYRKWVTVARVRVIFVVFCNLLVALIIVFTINVFYLNINLR